MSFTKVAPAGIGTEPGDSITIGDSFLHTTGIDIGHNTGIGVTIRKHGDATFTGIITASAFFGDGSGLEGVSSSGIGTPLSDDDTSELNKVYYVNQELSIGSTVTVNHPDSAVASYTHYQDLVVKDNADFIVADGDTFIPDVLGIRTSTSTASAATGGRIRAGTITNAGANGAPNFPNGLTGTAGTFTGSISAASGTITGNLGVGGVLTYEDVTNVDSVGVITARTDINLGDSIIHIGDTNTKIRFPAADTITAETGGSERLRITSGGQLLISGNTGWNESASLLSISTDAAAGANMLSDSSAIYNHNNPAFIHVQNRYNTGDGQEAGIIFHSKSSFNGSWAIYGKKTTSGYLSDLIFRNRTASSTSAERLRIGSAGQIGIAGANYGTAGQVLTSQGASSAVQWATPSSGLAMADQWRKKVTQNITGSRQLLTGWERPDRSGTGGGAYVGSGMSVSSDIFSFPATGIYLVTLDWSINCSSNNVRYAVSEIEVTKNNSDYYQAARAFIHINRPTGTSTGHTTSCNFIIDVDNATNDKVKFTSSVDNVGNHQVLGDENVSVTTVTFLRLGDT